MIDCAGNGVAIETAIRKAIDPEFRKICQSAVSSMVPAMPAADQGCSGPISLAGLIRKAFVDLPGPSSGLTGE